MQRKQRIHDLLGKMADELFEYIKDNENAYKDRWVPSIHIKKDLDLNFVCVPRNNKQYGEKGWLFAILSRILEDRELIEHLKIGNRAFSRTRHT